VVFGYNSTEVLMSHSLCLSMNSKNHEKNEVPSFDFDFLMYNCLLIFLIFLLIYWSLFNETSLYHKILTICCSISFSIVSHQRDRSALPYAPKRV
jgi:hypothetical protein